MSSPSSSSTSSSKNPGLKIHTPSPSFSLPRVQPTSNSVVITPLRDGFTEIARGLPTSTSEPFTAGLSGTEGIFFADRFGPSPIDETPFRSNFGNALKMSLSPVTTDALLHNLAYTPPTAIDSSSGSVNPATLLEQLRTSSSGTNSREGSFSEPHSSMMTMGIAPSALHVSSGTVSDESSSSGNTVHVVENSPTSVDEGSMGREEMHYSAVAGMMQQSNGGKWFPGEPPIYGHHYPEVQYGDVSMNLHPADVDMNPSLSGYYPPVSTQSNPFDAFLSGQEYNPLQSMGYNQAPSYPLAPHIGYPQITPPTATGYNFTGISPISQHLPSPHLSAHSSPLLSHPSPHLSTASSSSPFMSRNDNLHHQRNLSTASSMSIYSHSHHLSPASVPTSISPSMISRHVGSESGVDESGSSAYSPYSHSHSNSHSHSHSASQSQSYSHSHSRHVSTSAAIVGTSGGNVTVGQWADSYRPGLRKSIDTPLSSFPSASTSASATGLGGDKKRKRTSKHIPRLSISSCKEFTSLSGDTFNVDRLSLNSGEEDGNSYGDSEEEDEYVGVEASDADGDDEEYEIPKKGRRATKKRRVTPLSDEDPHFSPSQSRHQHHHNHAKDNKASAKNDYGATIKLAVLIPVTPDLKSCPHCGFVPSNGRFSDLKRHHAKHLLNDAGGKEKWVCTLCGDIKEELIFDEEDGEQKLMRVYYPKKGLQMQCKTYTRKDSTKRHWNKEHGDKGVIWDAAHLTTVHIVREED